MTKKSWFGSLMGSEREEHHFVMVRDKPLSQVKADLIHAFLSVSSTYSTVIVCICGDSLPNNKILDMIILKAFADAKINVAKMMISVFLIG